MIEERLHWEEGLLSDDKTARVHTEMVSTRTLGMLALLLAVLAVSPSSSDSRILFPGEFAGGDDQSGSFEVGERSGGLGATGERLGVHFPADRDEEEEDNRNKRRRRRRKNKGDKRKQSEEQIVKQSDV